jgi:hypothetical protein
MSIQPHQSNSDPRISSLIAQCLSNGETLLAIIPCFELTWETIEYGNSFHQRVQQIHSFELAITNQSLRTFTFDWRISQDKNPTVHTSKLVLKAFKELAKQRSISAVEQIQKEELESRDIYMTSKNEIGLNNIVSQMSMTTTPRSLFFAANNRIDPGGRIWDGFFDRWGNIDIDQTIGVYIPSTPNPLEIYSFHEEILSIPEIISSVIGEFSNDSDLSVKRVDAQTRLEKLTELFNSGLITEDEFAAKRSKIIDDI